MNWTEQGVRTIKTWPERVADARKRIEGLGGKLHSLYVTMGAYDAVGIIDGLDDAAMAQLAISVGQLGNVRTATLRAFPEAEAVQLIKGS